MKRYLFFLALAFGLTSGCHAASPSFSSFYTNHFLTNGLVIKANLNPTQFDTNASSITITITNIGDVPGSGVFTNVAGVIKPKPNQTTNALLFISGSADAATNTALTVDTVNTWTDENTKLLSLRHRGTNVAYITPYGSFESGRNVASAGPSRDDIILGVRDTSLGESDYALIYTAAIDGNSPTNFSFFRSQLQSGASPNSILSIASVTNGVTSRFTVQLQPDQGVSGIDLLNQDKTTFKVIDNGSIYLLPDAYTYWGDSDYSIVSIRDLDVDSLRTGNGIAVWSVQGTRNGAIDGNVDTNLANFSVGVANGSFGSSIVWSSTPTDLMLDGQFGTNNPSVFRLHPTVADLSANSAYTFDTPTWQLKGSADLVRVRNAGTNLVTIGPSGGIGFGPHANGIATNVLYRSGSSLVVTNGATTNAFTLRNGLGTGFHMTYNTGGNPRLLSDNGSIYMGSTLVAEANIVPNLDNTRDLGSSASNGAFNDLFLKGFGYIVGDNDGSGNASWMKFSHTGSAGSAIIDSAATGTGVARDFLFRSNGVTIAKINLNSGYGGAGTKYLDDAGNYTVPGGGGGAANWSASGTTNSTLAGRASVNDVSLLTQDPTIVPLKLNTIAGHTNWLATLNSGSTNFLTVDKKGNIGIGLTNIFANKSIGITRVYDVEGSGDKAWINIGGMDTYPSYNHASEWWANTGTNDGVMDLSWLSSTAIAPTKDHVWSVGASDGSTYYRFKYSGTNRYEMDVNGNVTTIGWVTLASLKLTGITKAQKTALTPVDGMVVYQTDNTPGFRGYVNGSWVMFSTVADP